MAIGFMLQCFREMALSLVSVEYHYHTQLCNLLYEQLLLCLRYLQVYALYCIVGEFECPYVKVSRCCGLKITSEGYVVTLAKNNHHVLVLNTLYIS